MSRAKLALVCVVAPMTLAACGSAVHTNVPAGSPSAVAAIRGRVDDPRTQRPDHVKCLLDHHLPVQLVGATDIQIGPLPAGPTVVFTPTEGIAQGDQIQGRTPDAEVIGAALLYPHQAPDSELGAIEQCLAKGVKG